MSVNYRIVSYRAQNPRPLIVSYRLTVSYCQPVVWGQARIRTRTRDGGTVRLGPQGLGAWAGLRLGFRLGPAMDLLLFIVLTWRLIGCYRPHMDSTIIVSYRIVSVAGPSLSSRGLSPTPLIGNYRIVIYLAIILSYLILNFPAMHYNAGQGPEAKGKVRQQKSLQFTSNWNPVHSTDSNGRV